MRKHLFYLAFFSLFSQLIHAQDETTANFTVNFNIASVSLEEKKVSNGLEAEKVEKNVSTSMFPNSLELVIGVNDFNFYLYPISEESDFGFGYMVTPDWEVGMLLGVNYQDNDGPDDKSTAVSYSLFAASGLEVSEGKILEYAFAGFSQSLTSRGPQNEDGTRAPEEKITVTGANLSFTFLYSIATNYMFYHGISYDYVSSKPNREDAKTENNIGITVLGNRLEF